MSKKLDNRIEILRTGKQGEFWGIICELLDESITRLQSVEDHADFIELPAEQYKLQSQLLKAKRKYLEQLKGYPDLLIAELGKPDSEDINFDPYPTADEV